VGLVVFDGSVREVVPIARGVAHGWRVVQTAVDASTTPRGNTRLEAALRAARIHGRRRTVAVVFSDFRESPGRDEPRRRATGWTLRQALGELSRRHDVVAAPILDRLELTLPRVGPVRIADPERPGRSWVLDAGSRRTRRRYPTACAERRRNLADVVRHGGAELLWLRTDQSPLHALGRFFHERAAQARRAGDAEGEAAALESALRLALERVVADARAVTAEELIAREDQPSRIRRAAQLLATLERARFDPAAPPPDATALLQAIDALNRKPRSSDSGSRRTVVNRTGAGMDRHTASVMAKSGAALLGGALLLYYWSGARGVAGNNLFLNAALVMCIGLVLLSDRLIDEPGIRAIARIGGYVGIAGIAIATLSG
jgi:hypothetical protein